MHKYEIIIYWGDEDGAFVAEVPELLGCAAHGDTPDSALANCQEAIELWIATAKELGRRVPEPKGQRLQFGVKGRRTKRLHGTAPPPPVRGNNVGRPSLETGSRVHFVELERT